MFTPMEFHPTLYEVEQANRFFWNYMKKEAECIMLPESEAAHMSLELAVRCAAANVWTNITCLPGHYPKIRIISICAVHKYASA